jgi:IS30 family transposase
MKYTHITGPERLEISILLEKGYSHEDIGSALGRSQTSVSREIKRNSVNGKYQPEKAKAKARVRRRMSKYQGMKVNERPELEKYIIAKLKLRWTPEEIAGRLKKVDSHLPYISGKGIYKWLYSAYGQKYCHLLPKQRYRLKKRRGKKTKREMIPNRVGIEHRPVSANERAEFGHFEEDTMVSGRRTGSKAALAVFCERKARYTKLGLMKNMKPKTHVKVQKRMAKTLRMKTITYDNGIENKNHEELALALSVRTFFCDPYSSYQKGTVENTIGRVRRFIPKGADLSTYTAKEIQKIEDWLNHTPRKCLNFRTPHEIMTKNLRFISSPFPCT